MEPMINVLYTTDQQNRLLTRRIHYMVGTRLENGAYLNVIYNRHFEWLDEPFRIRPDVTIPAGTYRFGQDLTPAEAQALHRQILDRFPQYGRDDMIPTVSDHTSA